MWVVVGIAVSCLIVGVIAFAIVKLNQIEAGSGEDSRIDEPLIEVHAPGLTPYSELLRKPGPDDYQHSPGAVGSARAPIQFRPIISVGLDQGTTPSNLQSNPGNRQSTNSKSNTGKPQKVHSTVRTARSDRHSGSMRQSFDLPRTKKQGRSMNSLPMTFNPQADVPSGKVRLVPQAPHIGSKPSTPSAVYHQNAIALPIKDGVVSPNLNTSAPDFLKRRRVIADTAHQALQQLYRLSEGATSEMFGEFDIRKIEMLADGRLDPFTLISDESATRKYYHEGSTTLNAFLNLGIELFHFTAENNVPSILDKGLLSANLLRSKGVTTVHVSDGLSQSLDRTRGLDRYVHLFFTRDAAMKYSVSQRTETSLAWFRVSPAVLDWPGTLFCRNYANKNGAEWVPFSEMTSLDLTLLLVGFGRIGYWQAMVQNNVPPLYLRSI